MGKDSLLKFLKENVDTKIDVYGVTLWSGWIKIEKVEIFVDRWYFGVVLYELTETLGDKKNVDVEIYLYCPSRTYYEELL